MLKFSNNEQLQLLNEIYFIGRFWSGKIMYAVLVYRKQIFE